MGIIERTYGKDTDAVINEVLISSDSHVIEPALLWKKNLPQAFQAVGRVKNFPADTVGRHLGNTLVFLLRAARNVIGSLPAKIRRTIFECLRKVFFP